MLWFGTVLGVAIAAAGFFAWRLLRARRLALGNFVGVIGLGVWLLGVTIAWVVDRQPREGRSDLVQSLDSLAWPDAPQSPLVTPQSTRTASAATTDVQVAPVESLIGGLEARLAANPADANGWALLAQSYAFTANEAATEHAIRRAVELGVDEQTLRDRVQGAKRSVHPGGWQTSSAEGR